MNKAFKERRKDPRISNNVPVKICQEDGDIVTETDNISRCGAYCRVNRYIEPMTKFKVHLLLPIRRRGKDATKKITCEGVTVRTEPGIKDGYHVAIFFQNIAQRDAESIADYISSFLEKEVNTDG